MTFSKSCYFPMLGYRHVPLLMNNGERIPSATIFIHVEIKDLSE